MVFPQIAVEGDPVPEELAVRILVEVIEEFSEQSPARLSIRLKNESTRQRSFYCGDVAPFNAMANEHPEERILCIIPDDSGELYSALIPTAPEGDCWRLKEQYLVPLTQRVVAAPPGGEVSNTYSVLSMPDTEACLPLGTYRFESRWGLQDSETKPEQRHTWGFELELSE